jgi:hypothetical protein
MSKLGCLCGHTMMDKRNDLPYKGKILPDTLLDNVFDFLTDAIDDLEEANRSNQRLDWVKKNFLPSYPTNLKDSSMIHDVLARKLMETTQEILQCENCGRIAIEVGQTGRFKFFSPDSDDTSGILSKVAN